MLRRLAVRNFAVVAELELELGEGLTVFTGETGAGKSILVEALGFLLGQRGSADWVRAGAERLEVAGTFDGAKGALELRRELDASGRSRAFLGGKPIPLAALAELGEALADFHGQHENQSLLRPGTQLDLLDDFGGHADRRAEVAGRFERWRGLKDRLAALQLSEEERLRRLDLYRFQCGEIDEVSPRAGEDEALLAELPRLKNAGRLGALAEQAHALLYDQEGSAVELLGKAEQALLDMARLDPALSPAAESVGRAKQEASEASDALASYRERVAEGTEGIDRVLGRQDKLARLKKKYGATLPEVLAYRERIGAELSALENHGERSAEIERELRAAEDALAQACERIHRERAKAAKRLAERVAAELAGLGMAAARLSVSVEMEEGAYSASGCDRVEFLIAPNPGEGLKSLRSVASGGELSRAMLALKTVLAREDKVELLVFDEVDAGVGGAVARAVGEKLGQIARSRQVLAVTHLPQVACFAGAQLHVEKSVSGGRTAARVRRIEGDERLEVLALMLGGRKATEASRRHAKELMESI